MGHSPERLTLWWPTRSWTRKATPASSRRRAHSPGPRRGRPTGVPDHGTYARVAQEHGRSRRLRTAGTAVRDTTRAVGASRSRSAAVRAMKWGNRPKGPRGAKGGAVACGPARDRMGETSCSPTIRNLARIGGRRESPGWCEAMRMPRTETKPQHEEPDAGNLHVRVRGGPAG